MLAVHRQEIGEIDLHESTISSTVVRERPLGCARVFLIAVSHWVPPKAMMGVGGDEGDAVKLECAEIAVQVGPDGVGRSDLVGVGQVPDAAVGPQLSACRLCQKQPPPDDDGYGLRRRLPRPR